MSGTTALDFIDRAARRASPRIYDAYGLWTAIGSRVYVGYRLSNADNSHMICQVNLTQLGHLVSVEPLYIISDLNLPLACIENNPVKAWWFQRVVPEGGYKRDRIGCSTILGSVTWKLTASGCHHWQLLMRSKRCHHLSRVRPSIGLNMRTVQSSSLGTLTATVVPAIATNHDLPFASRHT